MFRAITFFCLIWVANVAAEITHGPVLGRPGSDTMSVWARTRVPGETLQVRYGLQPGKLLQLSKVVATVIEDDCTGLVKLSGLKPATRYYYEVFSEDGDHPPGGSFKTLPSAAMVANRQYNPEGLFNFSFEFACGNNRTPGAGAGPSLPAFDQLNAKVRDRVDFAILNGDWLYEARREYPAGAWAQQVAAWELPDIVELAPGITGIWENYKFYWEKGDNLREWHRHVPSFYTYDDHESLNDIYGTGEIGFRNRRAVVRDIAVRAWDDYLAWANPTEHAQQAHFGRATLKGGSDILVDSEADFTALKLDEMANLHIHWGGQAGVILDPEPDSSTGDPNHGVYEVVEVIDKGRLRIRPAARVGGQSVYSIGKRCYGSFKVGNCEFFLLDTRSHRDLHDVDRPAKPGTSMIGKVQRNWLIKAMDSSEADFLFVVSSVNFMVPHVGSGGGKDVNEVVKKDDAWTVFLEEREMLIDFWDRLKKRVFVLTGDLHNSFAIKVTDNVWEFASGPHNSVNHRPKEDEGDRPANGPFKYGPRACDIRWSTYVLSDIPRVNRIFPHYCVVQINNVFNNPLERDGERWVAFPKPHVMFQFYDGLSGELRYCETIHAR